MGAKEKAPACVLFWDACLAATQSTHPKHDLMNNIEILDRQVTQAKAVLICLSANDHFKELSPETVANTLWLLNDRMDDIQKGLNKLAKTN